MDMPCTCECGEAFDLESGNPCDKCDGIFCHDCVPEPWDCCPQCRERMEVVDD